MLLAVLSPHAMLLSGLWYWQGMTSDYTHGSDMMVTICCLFLFLPPFPPSLAHSSLSRSLFSLLSPALSSLSLPLSLPCSLSSLLPLFSLSLFSVPPSLSYLPLSPYSFFSLALLSLSVTTLSPLCLSFMLTVIYWQWQSACESDISKATGCTRVRLSVQATAAHPLIYIKYYLS